MNIDRIAREMVDVEPSVDLEARIRARVRQTDAQSARTAPWWTWRIAAPLGALAAITLIIAVQVYRSSQPVEVQRAANLPAAVQRSAGLPAGAAPAGAVAKAGAVAQPGSKITTSRLRKVPASQLSSEELAWMERRMPALDPVNALQMDHLRVDSIQPQPLAITPLTMTPVTTESGGIERRNDR